MTVEEEDALLQEVAASIDTYSKEDLLERMQQLFTFKSRKPIQETINRLVDRIAVLDPEMIHARLAFRKKKKAIAILEEQIISFKFVVEGKAREVSRSFSVHTSELGFLPRDVISMNKKCNEDIIVRRLKAIYKAQGHIRDVPLMSGLELDSREMFEALCDATQRRAIALHVGEDVLAENAEKSE